MIRRRWIGVPVVALVGSLMLQVTPAMAADGLEEYLADAEDAEYAGRRIVMTSWDGDSEIGIYDVTHAGGVTVIDDGQTRVSDGKVAADAGAVAILDWSRAGLADRYDTPDPRSVDRLGRAAHAVDIYEGELLRATFVFDDVTGAPLLTEMYDGAGDLFRYSAMLDFDARPELVYRDMEATGFDYDVMVPVVDPALPQAIAGYTRTDAYRGADDWMHTFFSDGLFSFSVFEMPGEVTLNQFQESSSFEAGGSEYGLLIEPTEVWVTWRTSASTFVLVGDLPPDHLRQVLEELPEPDRPGLFRRLWRGLFG